MTDILDNVLMPKISVSLVGDVRKTLNYRVVCSGTTDKGPSEIGTAFQ